MWKLLLCVGLAVGAISACTEAPEGETETDGPPSKIAKIYLGYAVEMAGITLTPDSTEVATRCVQNQIVSKGVGLYRQAKLQALFLDHIFPDDLSSYGTLLDEKAVQDGAIARIKELGFLSYEEAVKSNNMIVRSLLADYTYYARFREMHDISAGVKPENLVLKHCVTVGE